MTRSFYFGPGSTTSADYFRFFAGLLAFGGLAAVAGFADFGFVVGAGFGAAALDGGEGVGAGFGAAPLAGGEEGGTVLCAPLDPAEDFGTLDCAATGVLETGLAYGAAWAAAERAAASAFAAAARSDASFAADAFAFSPGDRFSCAASASRISRSPSSGVICPRRTMY